ncbi:MAG TPA: dephospho-CoA kinase, partial [Candidatus Hydrogenedentes bacterium]|nr:dephospho-CoA kinase [Candidatus Hydrogenedentota bacterium]
MRLYGLTGGIGAGKSEAARLLAARGVPVLDADRIGHEVLL